MGGLLALALPSGIGWRTTMMLILIPVLTYGIMLAPRKFPQSERVAAGVTYREMLAEAGFVSAFVVALLMVFEVARVVGFSDLVKWLLIAGLTVGYGLWSRSAGRPIFIVMVLILTAISVHR